MIDCQESLVLHSASPSGGRNSLLVFLPTVVINEEEAAPLRLLTTGKRMNGQANSGPGTGSERVFRSHDRPIISVPELVAMQRGYLERLGAIVEQLSAIARRPDALATVIESTPRDDVTDTSANRSSVLMSKPFTGVTVHADAGRLVFDLCSIECNVRMQLTRRDLPVLLKTLIDAAAQLAAAAE